MAIAVHPLRDDESRAHLELVARKARPVVLAGERVVPVPGRLGELLAGGAVQRGSVVALDGAPGSGSTSVALQLAAAATAAGEWAVAVELDSPSAPGGLGGLAAGEEGVALERFAVVRQVPPARWATVVAALLDGIGMVIAEVPARARPGDARRLLARARERGVVLVALGGPWGSWPGEAAVRLRAEGSVWREGGGFADRDLRVRVEDHGAAKHGHAATA